MKPFGDCLPMYLWNILAGVFRSNSLNMNLKRGAVNLSKIKNRTFGFTDELLTSVLGSVYGITAFVF